MNWRLIELPNTDIYHMHAVEDLMVDLVEHHNSNNTILLSTVQPSVSISRDESYYLDIDEEACVIDRVAITRRHSGGRSMYLDQNYLIVSIIRNDHKFIDVTQTYKEGLGMVIGALKQVTGREFDIRRDDILIGNKKIGGASQRNSNTYNMVHCYIRLSTDIEHMLKYVLIDGQKLLPHADTVKKYVTSIKEISAITPESFYQEFKKQLLKGIEFHQLDLEKYGNSIEESVLRYMDEKHIKGHYDWPSKGNCDVIVGSGTEAKLLIESLEGKVRFS